MPQSETDRTKTAQVARESGTSHALVSVRSCVEGGLVRGTVLGRPSAGFLAQLIVSGEAEIRPSRSDRSRVAAPLYAQTARLGA